MTGNEAAGVTDYVISHHYIDDGATIAVGIQRGQLDINIDAETWHFSPLMSRRLTAEIAVARMIHDMRYGEDVARD